MHTVRVLKAMLSMPALSVVGRVLWNFMNKNGKATLTYGKMLASTSITAAKAFWALPWWAKTAGLAAGAAFVYALGTWSLFG